MSTSMFILTSFHVMFVVVIMGGGIFNSWILDPAADKSLSPPEAGKLGSAVGKVWMMTALTSEVVILASGILMLWKVDILNSDLFHTTYGQLALGKIAVMALWFVTSGVIIASAMKVQKMSSMTPVPNDNIKASVDRMKLMSKINNLSGVIAILLAVAMRLQ
jgi:uncharacterized membrane protein